MEKSIQDGGGGAWDWMDWRQNDCQVTDNNFRSNNNNNEPSQIVQNQTWQNNEGLIVQSTQPCEHSLLQQRQSQFTNRLHALRCE